MKIGLIGSGFMGQAHAFGFVTAERVFELADKLEMAMLADANAELAAAAARRWGFAQSTGDWRELVASPAIDVVDITAPNALHKEIALAAIAAGKHVYCEKPLAPTAADALEMAEAAEAAGVKTQVGFNYLMNPMLQYARQMIAAGELGEIYSYRGVHAEDYMADPQAPISFRHDPVGGGVLADLGSHALATAEFLLGPIARVLGNCSNIIARRPNPSTGVEQAVNVDDLSQVLLQFENGARGSVEANWCATGRQMQHDFEVYGSRGALLFSQERFNELHFYSAQDAAAQRGFRRIEASPAHPPYGRFCVAPAHQIGFNDLKAIEIAGFINAIAGTTPEPFNFRAGYRIQHLVESIQRSSQEERWLSVK